MPHTIKLELSASDLVILKECQNTYLRQLRELSDSEIATGKIFTGNAEDAAEATAFYADLSRPLIKITDALDRILASARAQLDCDTHDESERPPPPIETGRFDTGSVRPLAVKPTRYQLIKQLEQLGLNLIVDANLVPPNVIVGHSKGAKHFTAVYLDTGVFANFDLSAEGTRIGFPELVKALAGE